MEKLTVLDTSNLNLSFSGAQQKKLCKKDVLHIVLLNYMQRFIQNQR